MSSPLLSVAISDDRLVQRGVVDGAQRVTAQTEVAREADREHGRACARLLIEACREVRRDAQAGEKLCEARHRSREVSPIVTHA
jgi:hypothetical protein